MKERWEDRAVDVDMMATDNYARVMKSFGGSIPEAAMTFEANEEEKIFEYGTEQLSFLELKGAELELCHKNSRSSIPFIFQIKDTVFVEQPCRGNGKFC